MITDYILVFVTLSVLLIASLSDLKKREVADWLSYFLIASSLGIRLIGSFMNDDWSYFLYGAAGFGIFFVLSHVLYYTGQWGGGDSKVLMGVGASMATFPEEMLWFFSPIFDGITGEFGLLVAFLVNLMFFGSVYGILWSFVLAVKNFRKFILEYKKAASLKPRLILILFLVSSILFYLTSAPFEFRLTYILLSAFSIFIFYLMTFMKIVEKTFMQYMIPVAELTPGDWIVKDVVIDKKVICGPKDLGIEPEQIDLLKRYEKKGKIKKVLIKVGIPFIPAFFMAYVFSIIFGNVIVFMIL